MDTKEIDKRLAKVLLDKIDKDTKFHEWFIPWLFENKILVRKPIGG